MRVRQLRISGYRNLHDVRVEFGDLTVLVGKNDAGKSNIVRAVELLMAFPRFDDVIDAEISFETKPEEWKRVFSLREPWVISDHRYVATDLVRLTIRWSIESDEIPPEVSSRSDSSNFRVVARVIRVTAGETLLLCEHGENGKIRFLEEQKGDVLGYGTSGALMDRVRKEFFGDRGTPNRMLIVDANRTIRPLETFQKEQGTPVYSEERVPNNLPEALAVYQDRVQPFKSRILDSLQEDLRALFPTYPAIRSLLEAQGGRRDVYFGAFPSTQVGAGVKQVLSCLHDIRRSPAEIVAVEEPEIHLHPEMQRAFFRYLRDLVGSRQLIITSHSPSIVADSPLASVRLVRSAMGIAVVEELGPDKLQDLCTELGIMPRDIFEFEAVLIVEGMTDEMVFAEIVRRDFQKHPDGLRVTVVPAGGWGSVGAYANAALLRRLNRPYLVVFDGDTESVPSVSKAKSSFLHRSGIDLKRTVTLMLADIEHYFVSPESVVRAFPVLKHERVVTALTKGQARSLKESLNALFLQDLGRKFLPEDADRIVTLSPDDEIPAELWEIVKQLRSSH